MSLTQTAKQAAASVPAAYLLSWAAGVPWDMVAAFLACVWTLGLMWQAWIWKPWVRPALERRGTLKPKT